jgi:hypothetical protein
MPPHHQITDPQVGKHFMLVCWRQTQATLQRPDCFLIFLQASASAASMVSKRPN